MKFPITKVEFTSDSDFNDTHPADSLLNDLITINDFVGFDKYEYKQIDQANLSKSFESDILLVAKPTLDKTHVLTLKVFRSNGDTLVAKSPEIVWE